MRKNLLLLVVVLLVFASACTTYEYKPYENMNNTLEDTKGNISPGDNTMLNQEYDILKYEGELIDLKPAV